MHVQAELTGPFVCFFSLGASLHHLIFLHSSLTHALVLSSFAEDFKEKSSDLSAKAYDFPS